MTTSVPSDAAGGGALLYVVLSFLVVVAVLAGAVMALFASPRASRPAFGRAPWRGR